MPVLNRGSRPQKLAESPISEIVHPDTDPGVRVGNTIFKSYCNLNTVITCTIDVNEIFKRQQLCMSLRQQTMLIPTYHNVTLQLDLNQSNMPVPAMPSLLVAWESNQSH